MSHRSPHTNRPPYTIAQGPLGDYVVAPVHAFNPESWNTSGNETYPLLKQHGVIATGTKMECLRGELAIRREAKLLLDASSFDSAKNFEEWASDFGFDMEEPESRKKAKKIYSAVRKETERLKTLLGSDYEEFLQADR